MPCYARKACRCSARPCFPRTRAAAYAQMTASQALAAQTMEGMEKDHYDRHDVWAVATHIGDLRRCRRKPREGAPQQKQSHQIVCVRFDACPRRKRHVVVLRDGPAGAVSHRGGLARRCGRTWLAAISMFSCLPSHTGGCGIEFACFPTPLLVLLWRRLKFMPSGLCRRSPCPAWRKLLAVMSYMWRAYMRHVRRQLAYLSKRSGRHV